MAGSRWRDSELKTNNDSEPLRRPTLPLGFLYPAFAQTQRQCLTTRQRKTKPKRKKVQGLHGDLDPYRARQIDQGRQALNARRLVLAEKREKDRGDPIRGISTDFIESFQNFVPLPKGEENDQRADQKAKGQVEERVSPAYAENEAAINGWITKDELKDSLEYSRKLTEPIATTNEARRDPEKERQLYEEFEAGDESAREAVNRILSLKNASAKSRLRANYQRIIDKFGRHNTDNILKPKAPSAVPTNPRKADPEPTPRAGPDTGSSEVQIGILTAKIHGLANHLAGNRKDKGNKRNLTLLLHRRQRLLRYMEKKERGSGRWFHMLKNLGLQESAWKGQIELGKRIAV